MLGARETGTVLLGKTRLGAVGGSLGGRGGVFRHGLDGRLGDIGVVLGVTEELEEVLCGEDGLATVRHVMVLKSG